MNNNVIVTGGGGFIGHHLCKLLDNHICIDDKRYLNDDLINLRRLGNFFNCSADDLGVLNQIPKIKTIYHLASHPNQKAVEVDSNDAFGNIVNLTGNIVNYCKSRNIRLVYISSSMVYGNFEYEPADENHRLDPTNLYGKYKMIAEDLVRHTLTDYIIVRPSAVYGPADNNSRVVSKWIYNAVRDKPIVVDNPSFSLDFTYVEDLVQFLHIAGSSEITGTFNFTRGKSVSLLEAAETIIDLTNSLSDITISIDTPSGVPKRGCIDSSKARSLFQLDKPTDFIDGVRKMLDHASTIY